MPARLTLLISALILGVACTSASAASGPVGATDGGTKDVGPGAPLTCIGIFECAASCADNPCIDACVTRGSAAGKSAAGAVASCYQTNSCADGNCLKTKCGAELDACLSQASAPPQNPTVPATGVVPASPVGKWSRFSASTANLDEFTFDTSGGAKRYRTTAFSFPGGCATSALSDSTGTVVFTDTKMTDYQTGGTDIWSNCGGAGIPRPTPTGAYEYLWSLKTTGQLVLVQATPECAQSPDSIGCTETYDKK